MRGLWARIRMPRPSFTNCWVRPMNDVEKLRLLYPLVNLHMEPLPAADMCATLDSAIRIILQVPVLAEALSAYKIQLAEKSEQVRQLNEEVERLRQLVPNGTGSYDMGGETE